MNDIINILTKILKEIIVNKIIPILITLLMIFGCEDKNYEEPNQSLIFISNEGNFGSSNGSISVFRGKSKIQEINNIGDVVQSILIHNDKLITIVNNSHLIKIYQITEKGLSLPGIEVSTQNSGPREMVIHDNKLYFTNHNTQDIKILNLMTYFIEDAIKVDGLPESIVSDGQNLWVAINMNKDWSSASSVQKINIANKNIVKTFEVGKGPQQLLIDKDFLWVSRTYYNDDFTRTFFGTSRINMINGEVKILEYGKGSVCGGDLFKTDGLVYRTYNGGVAPLNAELKIEPLGKIGAYNSNNLYSANGTDEKIFLGITSDYQKPDTVFVHNNFGELEHEYIVGASPGDYAVWTIK